MAEIYQHGKSGGMPSVYDYLKDVQLLTGGPETCRFRRHLVDCTYASKLLRRIGNVVTLLWSRKPWSVASWLVFEVLALLSAIAFVLRVAKPPNFGWEVCSLFALPRKELQQVGSNRAD